MEWKIGKYFQKTIPRLKNDQFSLNKIVFIQHSKFLTNAFLFIFSVRSSSDKSASDTVAGTGSVSVAVALLLCWLSWLGPMLFSSESIVFEMLLPSVELFDAMGFALIELMKKTIIIKLCRSISKQSISKDSKKSNF